MCTAADTAMDQEAFPFDSRRFILSHHEEIQKRVDLDTLVPKLYRKRLLTHNEREDLLYLHLPPSKRKARLVEIIANKGNEAPRLFIECLREEASHIGHSELATILENNLRLQRQMPSNSTATDASANSALPCSGTSQNPAHDPCTSAALGTSSHMPLRNDCFTPAGHPSSSGIPVADSLHQLQRSSPEFANLILSLAAEFPQRGFTFENIRGALLALFENVAIPIQLPPHVKDFPTLCLHLRRSKMCHEADVDLLCVLLETLRQDDLKERVKAYALRGAATDVMQYRCQKTGPIPRHFLAFTFHSVPSLSLGQACEIKEFISDLLHISRHAFTLVGSEPGSIGLAWQIPVGYLKNVRSSLEEDEQLRASVISSKFLFESIQLQIEEGSERIDAFRRPTDPISNIHVGTTTCASVQESRGQSSISSQEDAVSSTMDDLSPSIDSECTCRKLGTFCVRCMFDCIVKVQFYSRTFKEKSFAIM